MIRYDDFKTALPNAREYSNYMLAVCPFHDDSSPSLMVFKDGYWRCLGCNKWGGWIQLWNKLKGQSVIIHSETSVGWRGPNVDAFDSMEDLCYQAHLDLMQFSSFQWYLEMRGLEGRMETSELGYYEGWYTIPVSNEEGNFITAVFRAAPHVQKVSGQRYWMHHAPLPYVPDWQLFNRERRVFVVFGMLDALTLADLRMPVMTSTAGQSKFDPAWLDNSRKPVYILPDKGEEKAAIELQKALGWRGNVVRLEYPHGVKDPNGFFEVKKRDALLKQLLLCR